MRVKKFSTKIWIAWIMCSVFISAIARENKQSP